MANTKLLITVSLLVFILVQSSFALPRNTARTQIPRCSNMVSKSQCNQNPKCKWCKSEVLDDMCFSKPEARRLPQQGTSGTYACRGSVTNAQVTF